MSKKLNVTDSSASNIVIAMADSLNIAYETENNEHYLKIPKSLGSGYVKSYSFDNGIGVVESDYLLKQDLKYELERGIMHPLKIMFNRESAFYHKFDSDKKANTIKSLESIITSSKPTNNHNFTIPANTQVNIFSLEINRKLFEAKIESFLPNMNDDLITLFRDVNGVQQFFYKGYFSLDVAELIQEFTACDLEGFMKSVFLEGKAYEILINQLQQYLDDLNAPEKRKILRKATTESLKEAVQIIEEEIENVDTVSALAKRVGLNQNTLQSGFKYLYKCSVKEYIKNYRLEMAKELLETSDLNITEVTYKIGINSRSYFSKIFKKRYGLTAKAYLEKVRKSRSA